MAVAHMPPVNEDASFRLADQYFDRLGLDWQRRTRLLESREMDLAALHAFDTRLCASAEAFLHLGEPAALRTLRTLSEPLTPRQLFAATVQAVLASEPDLFATCTALAGSLPAMRTAYVQAADWTAAISPDDTTRAWRRMRDDGVIPDIQLLFALASLRTPTIGATAHEWAAPLLKAARERSTLMPASLELARLYRWPNWDVHAHNALQHIDVNVRAAAVRYLLTLGNPLQRQQAYQTGVVIATACGAIGDTLIGPLMRAPRDTVMPIVLKLRAQPALWGRLIDGLAWHGDPYFIDRALRPLFADSRWARRAAAAITALTGSDPRIDGWAAASAPPEKSESPGVTRRASDPERGWPWPDADAFDQWWTRHGARFKDSSEWLFGHPPSAARLVHALLHAPLRWRPIAAWRLQQLDARSAIATDLPAPVQREHLSKITESMHESV